MKDMFKKWYQAKERELWKVSNRVLLLPEARLLYTLKLIEEQNKRSDVMGKRFK